MNLENSINLDLKKVARKEYAAKCKKYLRELVDFNFTVLLASFGLYCILRILYPKAHEGLLLLTVGFPSVYAVYALYEIFIIYLDHWTSTLNIKYPATTRLLYLEDTEILTKCKKLANKLKSARPSQSEELATLHLRTVKTFKTPLEKVDLFSLYSEPNVRASLQQANLSGTAKVEDVLFKISPKVISNSLPTLNNVGSYLNAEPVYPHSIMNALKEIKSYKYLFPSETSNKLKIQFDDRLDVTVRSWIHRNIIGFLVDEIFEVDKYLTEHKHFHLLSHSPASRRLPLPHQPRQPAATGFGTTSLSFTSSTAAKIGTNPTPNTEIALDLMDLYKQAPDLNSRKMVVRRLAIERYLSITPFASDRALLCSHLKDLSQNRMLAKINGDYGLPEVEMDNTLELPTPLEAMKLIPGLEITDTHLLIHLILTYFDLNYSPNAPTPLLDGTFFSDQFFVHYGHSSSVACSPYLRQLSPGKSHLVVVSPHSNAIYDIPRGDSNLFIALGVFAALAKKEISPGHALLRPAIDLLGLIPSQ